MSHARTCMWWFVRQLLFKKEAHDVALSILLAYALSGSLLLFPPWHSSVFTGGH